MSAPKTEIANVRVELIDPFDKNARLGELDDVELAQSIERHGLIQPIVVTPRGRRYGLIAGHRRLSAAKRAGLEVVPAVVRDVDEAEREDLSIAENLHRLGLSPVEQGLMVQRLIKDRKLTQVAAGKLLGKSQTWIAHRLRLLSLPKDVMQQVHDGSMPILLALSADTERRYSSGKTKSTRPGPKIGTHTAASRCLLSAHRNCSSACEVRAMAEAFQNAPVKRGGAR